MVQEYSPPVHRLLTYGEPQPFQPSPWPDYVSEFGFTAAHVPELLKLMVDPDLIHFDPNNPPSFPDDVDPETAWGASGHAMRSLAQLKALEIFEQAITVIHSDLDEWAGEELVNIIQGWGPAVIEPVVQLIEENLLTENRILSLINGLFKLPEQFPETRDRVIAELMRLLKDYPSTNSSNASFLAMGLIELKAMDAIDLLEQAFTAGRIDDFMTGTWPSVQIEFGLKSASDFTEEELTPTLPPALQQMRETLAALERQRKPDAFDLGMPLDPSAFPSSKPPGFDDMLGGQNNVAPKSEKGFGSGSEKNRKGQKGKKKKR